MSDGAAGSDGDVRPGHDGVAITEHLVINRASWNQTSDAYQAAHSAQLSTTEPGWGVWQIPERRLRILGDVAGLDVLELGCGAAQWSICLARQGARAVGLDFSVRQLAHARELNALAGVDVPLVLASAEDVPLAAAAFDVVFCDYGAMTFADPLRTVPEATRLLRPGGLLAFCHSSPLLELCWTGDDEHPGTTLQRDYFGMRLIRDADQAWFQLPYGEWIRLFRANGLAIEDLLELQPDPDAISTYRDAEHRVWAQRWPAEQIWKLRRR